MHSFKILKWRRWWSADRGETGFDAQDDLWDAAKPKPRHVDEVDNSREDDWAGFTTTYNLLDIQVL